MICKIDNLVDRKSYSVTEISDFIGCSRQYYYNILTGKQVPNIIVADLICKYFLLKLGLHVNIYDLFEF